MTKAQGQGLVPKQSEFARMVVSFYGEMLSGRLEVLSDSQDGTSYTSEVPHHREDLLVNLAQPEHKSGFCNSTAFFGPRQHFKRSKVVGLRPYRRIQRWNSFEIMI